MDKNTILAIVLSVIVITVGMGIQTKFFAPEAVEVSAESEVVETVVEQPLLDDQIVVATSDFNSGRPNSLISLDDGDSKEPFIYETNVFIAQFDPVGAGIKSLRLKNHLDNGDPVELIFNDGSYPAAFSMYLGDDISTPINSTFNYKIVSNGVEFSQKLALLDENGEVTDQHFTLTKKYRFNPNDYLFEISIELLNSQNRVIPLNYNGFAYTLAFEPQLGPEFHETPDGNYTYRRFYYEQNGKKVKTKLKDGVYQTDDHLSWAAVTGKYFSVIGITDATQYRTKLVESKSDNILLESRILFSRPALRTASSKDVFRFYVGPQLKKDMVKYNKADDNGFGISDLNLENALDSNSWLGWLESILKWLLTFFYSLIPNYGVAIILLTILIKLVLQPFSKKSMESTAKMAALNPQMSELREKYKDNPTKLNQEMSELYKKEKINPLGGCLPMLFQFPIFIALYGLLNKHFELRGAMFIPGWITDLSLPETIFNFAPLSLPVIGSNIRLLPILYVTSMILSFKINQTGAQQGGMSGKMMMLGMPIMFFFILYNAPSGLLLYWMVMNFITIGQQLLVNRKKSRGELDPEPKKFVYKGKKS
ncbi:MAG: membrane protein insertase YidC [Sphaerochaetaceae bacterium]|jgi:YidC/Oxa1 family membrane protein insertase